jgi:hypothetical protein
MHICIYILHSSTYYHIYILHSATYHHIYIFHSSTSSLLYIHACIAFFSPLKRPFHKHIYIYIYIYVYIYIYRSFTPTIVYTICLYTYGYTNICVSIYLHNFFSLLNVPFNIIICIYVYTYCIHQHTIIYTYSIHQYHHYHIYIPALPFFPS